MQKMKKVPKRIQFYLHNVVSVENSSGVTTISVLSNCALHLFKDDTHYMKFIDIMHMQSVETLLTRLIQMGLKSQRCSSNNYFTPPPHEKLI